MPVALYSASLLLGLAPPGQADDAAVWTAGFQAHVQPQHGGRIDWTAGHILADGRGVARGRDPQDRAMSERAATLDAAANALAIAAGVPIDANGRTGGIRNGRVLLQGVIRGHDVVSVEWLPSRNPPECRVRLKVPLWGVQGVASVVAAEQRRAVARQNVRRAVLAAEVVDVSEAVLVLDARGTGLAPCLYPVVLDEAGLVIYDLTTPTGADARTEAPVRYVETRDTIEELRCAAEGEAIFLARDRDATSGDLRGIQGYRAPRNIRPVRNRSHSHRLETGATFLSAADPALETDDESPTTGPASRPATQPTTQQAPRRARRVVFKAARASGAQQTQIVLSREDAEKLRGDPQGAGLLRSGRVVVIVDSPAAGIEGRLDRRDERAALAMSPP